MNLMFAAGLFDSPWVVAAIIIIGAFINWLSQLRQQKQQRDEERRARRESEPEAPQKPPGEFDLEETLKRWMGEQETQPPPAPPPIPRPPEAPPVWHSRAAPPVIVSPLATTMPLSEVPEVSEVQKLAATRLAQATGQVRGHHAGAARVRRGRGEQWSGMWRDRSSARRAFVSSLVFGPPKGLES